MFVSDILWGEVCTDCSELSRTPYLFAGRTEPSGDRFLPLFLSRDLVRM
jgi:hypothetical protein